MATLKIKVLTTVVAENDASFCWVGITDAAQIVKMFSSVPQPRLKESGFVTFTKYGMTTGSIFSKEDGKVCLFIRPETTVSFIFAHLNVLYHLLGFLISKSKRGLCKL